MSIRNYGVKTVKVAQVLQAGGLYSPVICAKTLTTQAQDILFLGVAHGLPVEPFFAAAHTATAKSPLI
jgi:hypothetical protein